MPHLRARERHTDDIAEGFCERLFDIGTKTAQQFLEATRQLGIAGNVDLARRHQRFVTTAQGEREQTARRGSQVQIAGRLPMRPDTQSALMHLDRQRERCTGQLDADAPAFQRTELRARRFVEAQRAIQHRLEQTAEPDQQWIRLALFGHSRQTRRNGRAL
jgi:hypothetical protein